MTMCLLRKCRLIIDEDFVVLLHFETTASACGGNSLGLKRNGQNVI